MNIFAVTVTYGNRFYLLKQVVDRALTEGVQKVIVVDNKSDKESREQLKLYEQWLGKDKIKVLYLDDNCGSAGGFKRGLEEAYTDASCDYILVLDDDNLVGKNSISKILNVFSYLERLENNYMLSFYRDLRDDNKKIVETGWIKRYLPNNFLGFNFLYQLKNKFKKGQTKGLVNFFPLQPIEVTAMGG
ncbi:MAG: glycosyltransferase [Desulfovibrionales bacterium]|nr:glycosyltransferase [Desulfovibrionales bacterium]